MRPSRRIQYIFYTVAVLAVSLLAWKYFNPALESNYVIESNLEASSHLTRARTDTTGEEQLSLSDGIPDGYGVNKRPDGSVYVGNFVDGRSHGIGKITYPGGASYAGEFEEGMPHGKGTCTYSSGKSEVCEFLLGQRQ